MPLSFAACTYSKAGTYTTKHFCPSGIRPQTPSSTSLKPTHNPDHAR